MQTIELNPFQERLLSIPEEYDMFCGGGRGGGKSYGLAFLILRHVEQYGEKARVLYIRKTYKGLADFELVAREIFGNVYGTAARYNAAEHVWRFPNGAYFEMGELQDHSSYVKYQGRSFSLLIVDEAGQYADMSLLDMMRSNLRGSKNIPIRMVIAGNPGGVGHFELAKRYVLNGANPWEPFYEPKSKRRWVYAPSTFDGNTFIDRDQYREQLTSSCPDDPELLRSWCDGSWDVMRGAYFASCLDEKRNAVDPWLNYEIPYGWETWLAHDFGSEAPSVTYLMGRSPGTEHQGQFYPNGSIVLIDELAAVRKGNLTKGLGWNAAVTAEAIRSELCDRWRVQASGVADDACFARNGSSSGSLAEEMAAKGVTFQPARKADRISGWQRMRRLLANAGKPDVPGLYISRSCTYFWNTVPFLPRDEKRVEDVDTTGPDHAADACRYGLLAQVWARELYVKFAV